LHWSLILLVLLAAACGDDPPAGPRVPDLGGDQQERVQRPRESSFKLPEAPTQLHARLAGLMPLGGIVPDTFLYTGWDSEAADASEEDPARAALPTVSARYRSTGFPLLTEVESTRVERQEFPQRCDLFVIQAPEAQAAEPLARGIERALVSRGFVSRAPAELALGRDRVLTIACFERIDADEDRDVILTGYVAAFGDVVVYALEAQWHERMRGPDGAPLEGVEIRRKGTQYGAQLVFQVHSRIP
jgi:hypothetical protein